MFIIWPSRFSASCLYHRKGLGGCKWYIIITHLAAVKAAYLAQMKLLLLKERNIECQKQHIIGSIETIDLFDRKHWLRRWRILWKLVSAAVMEWNHKSSLMSNFNRYWITISTFWEIKSGLWVRNYFWLAWFYFLSQLWKPASMG